MPRVDGEPETRLPDAGSLKITQKCNRKILRRLLCNLMRLSQSHRGVFHEGERDLQECDWDFHSRKMSGSSRAEETAREGAITSSLSRAGPPIRT